MSHICLLVEDHGHGPGRGIDSPHAQSGGLRRPKRQCDGHRLPGAAETSRRVLPVQSASVQQCGFFRLQRGFVLGPTQLGERQAGRRIASRQGRRDTTYGGRCHRRKRLAGRGPTTGLVQAGRDGTRLNVGREQPFALLLPPQRANGVLGGDSVRQPGSGLLLIPRFAAEFLDFVGGQRDARQDALHVRRPQVRRQVEAHQDQRGQADVAQLRLDRSRSSGG